MQIDPRRTGREDEVTVSCRKVLLGGGHGTYLRCQRSRLGAQRVADPVPHRSPVVDSASWVVTDPDALAASMDIPEGETSVEIPDRAIYGHDARQLVAKVLARL